jgi:hypothetical protein
MRGQSFATAAIWITFAILIGSLLSSPTGAMARAGDAAMFGITLTLALAATISTIAIWTAAHIDNRRDANASHMARGLPVSKSKRRDADRVQRLIASLDDEDIYELESILLGRDAETHDQSQSS